MVKLKDFSRPLSVFQVLFKAKFIFKDFSRQSCIFKYFSSLWELCIPYLEEKKHSFHFPKILYRFSNAILTIHFSIITLPMKENIQERELVVYKYNCNSDKSITSVSFIKHVVHCHSEQVMF